MRHIVKIFAARKPPTHKKISKRRSQTRFKLVTSMDTMHDNLKPFQVAQSNSKCPLKKFSFTLTVTHGQIPSKGGDWRNGPALSIVGEENNTLINLY